MNYYDYISDISIINEAYKKLDEALPLSKAKEYFKGGWDKRTKKYHKADWNKSRLYDWFKGDDRIYLPLVEPIDDSKYVDLSIIATNQTNDGSIESEVKSTLSSKGYELLDYKTGKVKNEQGRETSVEKALFKLGSVELLKKYKDDPSKRGKADRGQPIVVISRHRYDIAGMSTDRGWTSCMNLGTKNVHRDKNKPNERGCEWEYVDNDSKNVIVAYLIDSDDRNITHPKARTLVVPYHNVDNNNVVIYSTVNSVYPRDIDPKIKSIFRKTVQNWLDEKQRGVEYVVAELDNDIYHDGHNPKIINANVNDYIKKHAKNGSMDLSNLKRDVIKTILIKSNNYPDVKFILPRDCGDLFFKSSKITECGGNWDVSNVTNMKRMFSSAKWAIPDVSNWDTSKVTNMSMMFCYAASAVPNVSNWNVSNVTNMYCMFYNAHSAKPDVSNWNVSNVANMDDMFRNASSAIKAGTDVENWMKYDNIKSRFNSIHELKSHIKLKP
jgi:surface protein